jgi:hypothetical protein
MKKLAALSLVSILVVAAATVAVWASMADAPWEESSEIAETAEPVTATPPSPAFAEEEVLSLASRMLSERAAEQLGLRRLGQEDPNVDCLNADYRPQNRMWVVTCDFDGGVKTATFTFDDQTGQLGD